MANSLYDGETPWSTGLCDCFSDCSLCWLTIFCPCITFGRSAAIITQGQCSCCENCVLYVVFQCLIPTYVPGILFACLFRRKLRGQFDLKRSPCNDFCVHTFCHLCALCQEYRELQNQGFDMKLGWEENVEHLQNLEVRKPPMTEGGMNR